MLKYRNGSFVPVITIAETSEPVSVTLCPAKLAYGARKPRNGGTAGAQTTGAMRARADRRAIQRYATQGMQK